MLTLLDKFIDSVTMYRLLLYYLIVVLCCALLLSGLGALPFSPYAIVACTLFVLVVCWLANRVFAYVFDVPHNPESSLITALILALIITPELSSSTLLFLAAAGGLAIASKYLLNIRGQHIFNPAAIAVVLTAFGAGDGASWWVGTAWLMPVVIVGGLLLARKVQRFGMIAVFVGVALLGIIVFTALAHGSVSLAIKNTTLSSALFFLAFVMLTEPLTSPHTRHLQYWYAGIVGLLFVPQLHIGGLYATPELALVAGNVFAYWVSPKVKTFLRFVEKIPMGPSSYDFVFAPMRKFAFAPGQYMEFTLAHAAPDDRGSRRYFTLASSPTEQTVHVGARFYNRSSTYKTAMLNLQKGQVVLADQLSGTFVLPSDRTQPIVLIAGGIGITPFRSMLKYLIDTNEQRPITLIYSERTETDIAYKGVLREAQKHGIKIICTLTDLPGGVPEGYASGPINAALIQQYGGDLARTLFYVSGPHSMVQAIKQTLHDAGVPRRHVKTDFFPGYA